MKKFTLFALSTLLSVGLWAAPRSMQQARTMAPGLRHARTVLTADGRPAFYVFNRPDEGGFILISADDRAHTILGYSDKGHWDENDLPENLRAWIESYAEAIASLATYDAPHATAAPTYRPIEPLCTTAWGQRDPFNRLCPTWQGNHAVTGCVATAAAQIMKRHNYPANGIGSHTYKWANENGDTIELSADFEHTTYDWPNMLDTYDAYATEEQTEAVSTLIYHCGVSIDITYGKSTSGDSHKMMQKFIENFGYDKGIRTYRRGYTPDSVIMENIYSNLRAGRPVFVSAKTVDNGGHAFVCDGIDAEGLLHINWGWYGKSDGFYQLSAFAPVEQGTGGSATNKAYTERVRVFTDIRPDINSDFYYSLSCENIRVGEPVYHRDSLVQFIIDTLHNDSYNAWTGNLRLLLYQNGEYFGYRTSSSDKPALNPGMYRTYLSYKSNFSDRTRYPDGEYEVAVAARATDLGSNSVIPIYCKGVGEWRCRMRIAGDSIYLGTSYLPEQPEGIQNTSCETEQKAQKMLRNGVLYIRRGKDLYTVTGLKVGVE